jgi:hypothetical protein
MAIRKIISRSITDGAVVATDVAALSIDSTKLASNAVTNAKIASNAISSDKLDTNIQFGFKNRIINGDMRIDQRNAGASVTPNNTYTLDRWNGAASQTSKFTVQRNSGSITPPVGYTNYLGVISSSAYTLGTSDFFAVTQSIEGYNIADFGWGTSGAKAVTLSAWVRSSLTGTFGGVFRGSGRYYPFNYSIPVANTWTQISITVPGDTSGTWATDNTSGVGIWFSLGAGSTYSGTAGSWSGGNYTSATGSVSVVGTSGATFYLTGVQLEVGSSATPFDTRAYGAELALCQRYFQQVSFVLQTSRSHGYDLSNYRDQKISLLPVVMRSSGTVVITSSATFNDGGTPSPNGATVAAAADTRTIYATLNYTSQPAGGTVHNFNYAANISSEL